MSANTTNGNYRIAKENDHTLDIGSRLGSTGTKGKIIRDVSVRTDIPHSTRGSCSGKHPDQSFSEADIGKILSQLREISESHLAYVNAHKARLATRLNDAEEHEQKFTNQVEAVEKQILSLMESLT